MVMPESSFGAYVCLRRPAGLHRDERSCGCHDGHFKALSRCQFVGSSVRPGENFSTQASDHVCTFDTDTGNLAVNSIFVIIYSYERYEQVSLFFSFFLNSFLSFPLPW